MSRILKKDTHGELQCYRNGCKCELCLAANRDHVYKGIESRAGKISPDDPRHGSASTYKNWSCRCEPCVRAHSKKCRDYDASVKERNNG